MDADFVYVGHAIVVFIAFVLQVNGLLAVVLAEQIPLLIFIAGGDEFFQFEGFKIVREIMKEIADPGIITVTVDNFVFEVMSVVRELPFNVGKLGVELVLFGIFCLM